MPVPKQFALHQNFPNPFNPSTNILLDLPQGAHVTLKIYDLRGQVVCRQRRRMRLPERLQAAGFDDVDLELRSMKPVAAVCVIGRRKAQPQH